jgi:fused signal recognition particle receptor
MTAQVLATSDVIVALVVVVPVALVAAGAALVSRRRKPSVEPPGSGVAAGPGPVVDGGPGAVAEADVVLEPTPEPEVEAPQTEREPEPTPEPESEPEPATYRGRLGKARGLLGGYLSGVRARGRIDAGTWDDLEEALIRADVGVGAADALLEDLRARVKGGSIPSPDALVEALKQDLVAMLSQADASLPWPGSSTLPDGEVEVWLFVGVNGVGKTTTVGKVAKKMADEGASVVLAAGDTFRAAAADQLALWAERSGADLVRGSEGGDPSSVIFDAVQRAAAKGQRLVLADTAGRLHNKVNLIEELKKIRRVADRDPGQVREVLLVLDATTGQNGLAQAKTFLEAVEVTGVVLTKLDGTAKGGIVVAIQRELGLPVKLVGLGEGAADLMTFDPEAFVEAIF